MSKKVYIVKNITFLINIILLVICTIKGLPQIPGTNTVLIYFVFVLNTILTAVNFIKDKKHVNYNDKYNLMFIIANLVVMFIMLRGIFDNSIITNIFSGDGSVDSLNYRMKFVANNLIYFNIIYISLILYPYTIEE